MHYLTTPSSADTECQWLQSIWHHGPECLFKWWFNWPNGTDTKDKFQEPIDVTTTTVICFLLMLNSSDANSTGVTRPWPNRPSEDALRSSKWSRSIHTTSQGLFCKIWLKCFQQLAERKKRLRKHVCFLSQCLVEQRFSICCSGPKAVYSRKAHTGGLQQLQKPTWWD